MNEVGLIDYQEEIYIGKLNTDEELLNSGAQYPILLQPVLLCLKISV